MSEEEFDLNLLGLNLPGEALECPLIGIRGNAECELFSELFGQFFLEPVGEPVVEAFRSAEAKGPPKVLGFAPVHPDQEPATGSITALKRLDVVANRLPTSKVEIPYAKICPLRLIERLLEGGKESFFNVVEDAGHFNNMRLITNRSFILGPKRMLTISS